MTKTAQSEHCTRGSHLSVGDKATTPHTTVTTVVSAFALRQNDSNSVVYHHQHASSCLPLPPARFLHGSCQATRSRRSNYPPVLAFTNVSPKRGRNYSAPFFTCNSGGVISQITPPRVPSCALSPSVASETRRSNYGTVITPPHFYMQCGRSML